MRYSLEAGMGTTLCLRCWAYRTACSPSVVPMACWSSKYSAGMPSFEQTSRLSTRCGFSSVRIVSSGAIHHSKRRMMQACFALVPQDNALRAFRSSCVRAPAPSPLALWAGFGRSMGPRRFRFQLLGTRTRAVKVDVSIAVFRTHVCAAQRLALFAAFFVYLTGSW